MATKKTHKAKASRGLFRTFTDTVFTAFSAVSVVLLWLCAASAYVSPDTMLVMSALGLAFPIVLAGTVAVFLLSLLFAPRVCWITLVGMLLCFGSIRSYCPLNVLRDAHTPSDHAFRVMTYNGCGIKDAADTVKLDEFLHYLDDQHADIICFQEGAYRLRYHSSWPAFFSAAYPYSMSVDSTTCLQIWSRHEILRSEAICKDGANAAVAFWLRHPAGKGELLVVNTHLKTNYLSVSDRERYKQLVRESSRLESSFDNTFHQSKSILGKVARAAVIRAKMSDEIADFVGSQPDSLPIIVCGDFNDTPISYACQRLKRKGLNDAFRMVGNGPGWSFNRDAIAVRIDHQFFTDHLQPLQAHIDRSATWSDHYPLLVTYEWK